MDTTMKPDFKQAAPQLLCSCGGVKGAMQNFAARIKNSESDDLAQILGPIVDAEGPINELIQTCERTNGVLDLEGLIRHFASHEHTHKMTNLKVTVANEFPREQIPFVHTLLPLTVVEGKYYYDCGDAFVELVGLVQIGPTVGSPYAHLAGLIWLPDNGLHTHILAEQATNGVAKICRGIERISYYDAPTLREGTLEGARQLYGTS